MSSSDQIRGTARVLVVEDDFQVRETVISILEEVGFETIAVNDAEHAFAALIRARRAIRTAVIDLSLPGALSGSDLSLALLAVGVGVVLMSADHERLDRLMRTGTAAICLPKPFRFNQLLDCVVQSLAAAAPCSA